MIGIIQKPAKSGKGKNVVLESKCVKILLFSFEKNVQYAIHIFSLRALHMNNSLLAVPSTSLSVCLSVCHHVWTRHHVFQKSDKVSVGLFDF